MDAVIALLCLLVVSVSGATQKGIVTGPLNEAALVGSNVTLICRVDTSLPYRVQWYEYATDSNGGLISDNNIVLPGHPNYLRYTIISNSPGQFDLFIAPTKVEDGAYYKCVETYAEPPDTGSLGAQLVMIEKTPNCTDTLTSDGVVIEGDYFTAECVMYFRSSPGIQPLMTWTGPKPFSSASSATDVSVWAGITFNVNRSMDTQMFTCVTNFTQQGFTAPDSASNIPTFSYTYRTQQIFVRWPPKNMYSSPEHLLYEVGETITCFVDAFPIATLSWHNMETNEVWHSQSFTIREDMVGNQTMRCHAENVISGITYYSDYLVPLFVKPIPTTPTPGLTTTTTAPPAEANCLDLTGRWEATNPKAIMCIWLDFSSNGVLTGLFKNGTDTFFADIYGRAQVNTFDQGGFSAIWPGTMGVSGHVLECRRCYGTEILTVSQISRSDASSLTCTDPGVTNYLPDFTFHRVANSPPCTSQPPLYAV